METFAEDPACAEAIANASGEGESDRSIRASIVDPLEVPDWDRLAAGIPRPSVFHTQGWAAVLRETYGYRPLYLVWREADRVVGLLPLVEIRSWLTGRRGVSLPFSDLANPYWGGGSSTVRKRVGAAVRLADERRWKFIEIRDNALEEDGVPSSQRFWQHEIDLSKGEAAVWERCDGAVRRGVRKADRAGLRLDQAHSPAHVDEFYRLQCLTRRRHGLPPQPREFFHNIRRRLLDRGQGSLLIARSNGRAVAGALFLRQGEQAAFKFGASDYEFQQLRASNWIMWKAIETYTRSGCQNLHLGRTGLDHAGLRRFKLGWGARESELRYFRYNLKSKSWTRARDLGEGRHTRWIKRLPGPVAQWAGALLYRHIG